MQKVAWATITVNRLSGMPTTWMNVFWRATPVTIPGRAIGSTTRKETVSRPKKRWRATANDAIEPSSRAMAVAAAPTLIEVQKASRAPELSTASPNQCVVKPGGGHWKNWLLLKALTAIT